MSQETMEKAGAAGEWGLKTSLFWALSSVCVFFFFGTLLISIFSYNYGTSISTSTSTSSNTNTRLSPAPTAYKKRPKWQILHCLGPRLVFLCFSFILMISIDAIYVFMFKIYGKFKEGNNSNNVPKQCDMRHLGPRWALYIYIRVF